LKLTVNEKKKRQCSVPSETLPFLGFTFGRQVSWESGKAYLGYRTKLTSRIGFFGT